MLGVGKIIEYLMGWKIKHKVFGLLLIFFSISSSHAQPHNKDSLLISRHRPGLLWYNTGWKPSKKGKLRKYDRLIVDLTYNMLLDPKVTKTRPLASIGWNINTMWDIPLTEGNTVSLGIGLAYKHQKTGLTNYFTPDSTNKYTQFISDSTTGLYSKVRFGNHMVSLPIELRFRQNKWSHVKFHVGGSIGYRFSTYQKYYEENGDFRKVKNLPDINRLVYGAHLRFGLRAIALFADYYISPNFKSKESAKIQGLTFGLSISVF